MFLLASCSKRWPSSSTRGLPGDKEKKDDEDAVCQGKRARGGRTATRQSVSADMHGDEDAATGCHRGPVRGVLRTLLKVTAAQLHRAWSKHAAQQDVGHRVSSMTDVGSYDAG